MCHAATRVLLSHSNCLVLEGIIRKLQSSFPAFHPLSASQVSIPTIVNNDAERLPHYSTRGPRCRLSQFPLEKGELVLADQSRYARGLSPGDEVCSACLSRLRDGHCIRRVCIFSRRHVHRQEKEYRYQLYFNGACPGRTSRRIRRLYFHNVG